jgi:hypothetical protein
MAALLIGYARVSTDQQDLTAQRDLRSVIPFLMVGAIVQCLPLPSQTPVAR